MLAKGYDSDQARDENGRFASGSGGEGVNGERYHPKRLRLEVIFRHCAFR